MNSYIVIILKYSIVCIVSQLGLVLCDDLRGGTISAEPISLSSLSVLMEFHTNFGWKFTSPDAYCDSSFFRNGSNSNKMIGQSYNIICNMCNFNMDTIVGTTQQMCIAYSYPHDWSYGQKMFQSFIPYSTNVEISLTGGSWPMLAYYSNNNSNCRGYWEYRLRLDTTIRNDTNKINSAPKTMMFPIFKLRTGTEYEIKIPTYDKDGDMVRCRWSNKTKEECGDVCYSVPFAKLSSEDCLLTLNMENAQTGYYVVALQIEDFKSSAENYAMSSVPLQFLLDVNSFPSNCMNAPVIVGELPKDACIAANLNSVLNLQITAQVNCSYTSIDNIEVIGPPGLYVSNLVTLPGASQSSININWTPNQTEIVKICAIATDTTSLSSLMTCYTVLAGYPIPTPSSVSPNGKLTTQFLQAANISGLLNFKVNFSSNIKYTNLMSAYIRFYNNETNSQVSSIQVSQCNSEIMNNTLLIYLPTTNFTVGVYYALLDYGVVTGLDHCNQISPQITSKTFWVFSIVEDLAMPSMPVKTCIGPTTTTASPETTTNIDDFSASSRMNAGFIHKLTIILGSVLLSYFILFKEIN